MVRHSLGHVSQVGACALALLFLTLITGTPAHHTHRDPGTALYDDACPDLRLAMSADSAGPSARPLTDSDVPLAIGQSFNGAAASVLPGVRCAQTDARAPPRPA
jgi:hypothetical protein